jgi:hypothetical protein
MMRRRRLRVLTACLMVHSITTLVFDSGEGRTPSAADWHAMRVNVAKLKMELDRVQLDFVDENSTQNIAVPSRGTGAANLLVNGGTAAAAAAVAATAAATAAAVGVVAIKPGNDCQHDKDNDDGIVSESPGP